MGRRSGFGGLLVAVAREAERAHKRAHAEEQRAIRMALAAERDREREARSADRDALKADREARRQYLEQRQEKTASLNDELAQRVETLKRLLTHTLATDDAIAFEMLRSKETIPRFSPPSEIARPGVKPTLEQFIAKVKEPSMLGLLIPGARAKHEKLLEAAQSNYETALERWESDERQRKAKLLELHKEHDAIRRAVEQKIEARNREIEELQRGYRAGDPDCIVDYCTLVLERSEYPDGFPQEFNIAYVQESRQLVVEYELPEPNIVPLVQEYRYVKAKDEISEKAQKQSEIKALYQDIVASVALRTIHELVESDQGGHLDTVCFNGFIQTVDPATGKDIRPHLISVRTAKQSFEAIDLGRIDKIVCLRNLGAQVSPRPAEAQPIRPIINFDMVDKRFVQQSDVLADLESRPNLMDLNPFEFEHLVANLFSQMGLESKLTRSSRDGGVDCVAFDPRPVLGGKVVIQAKRYRNTVGVSAVRDLFGTMMNEGANKGILVTTSGYGPDAHEFCKDKPIELIDGGGLLYLLRQHGTEARIVFPAEQAPDSPPH